jgi:ketosteroid isomerase-like protein
MTNAERVMRAIGPIFAEAAGDVDDGLITRVGVALEDLTSDELTGEMTADSSFSTEFEGREGLRDAWAEWLSAFSQVRIEIEEVVEIGANVVTLVNQVGTTRHGVEISQASAAVWKFRDGLIVRIEFHLDPERALASARESG